MLNGYVENKFFKRLFLFVELVVGCPSIYMDYVVSKVPKSIRVAAQNCYKVPSGAFTGEIRYVISFSICIFAEKIL